MIIKKDFRVKEIGKHLSDILEALEIVEENLPKEFEEFKEMGLMKDGIYKK